MTRTKRLLNIIYIVLTVTTWIPADAAEVAQDPKSSGPVTATAAGTAGRPTPGDAEKLFKGELPELSHVAEHYQSSRPIDICTTKWRGFMERSKKAALKPVRASLETLRANARKAGLSITKLERNLAKFLKNQSALPNQNYLTIVDFDKPATEKQMYSIDLSNGEIKRFFTSGSMGGDPRGTGMSTMFSNKRDESNAASLGCFVASGTYEGKRVKDPRTGRTVKRNSMVLHGIESSNDNACARSVIMHPADYVGAGGPARSWGCIATRFEDEAEIYQRVGDGMICTDREGPSSQAPGYFQKRKGRRKHSKRARRSGYSRKAHRRVYRAY